MGETPRSSREVVQSCSAAPPLHKSDALQRLEQKGLIDSEWRATENNRRAKYYALTAKGRRAVSDEPANWRRYVAAVELILGTT